MWVWHHVLPSGQASLFYEDNHRRLHPRGNRPWVWPRSRWPFWLRHQRRMEDSCRKRLIYFRATDGEDEKGAQFASLSFRIELKRRHLFHILNTVFPVFLVGMLIPFVYQLKEVSDRIAYSLTVLLSYAVYLSMIAANVPSTSVSVCYLCKYKPIRNENLNTLEQE